MDADEALRVLGLARGAQWPAIRHAFRAEVRSAHPDVTSDPAGSGRTAQLTAAYRFLERAHRAGCLPPPLTRPRPDPARASAASPRPAGTTTSTLSGASSGVLRLPNGSVFAALLEASHTIGEVVYIDPEAGLLQLVLEPDGGARCQLLVSIDERVRPPRVAFTLDPLDPTDTRPIPPIALVVDALTRAVPVT